MGGAPQASTAEIGPRVIAGLIDLVAIPIGIQVIGGILGRVSGALAFLAWLALIGYSWFYLPYTVGTTGQSIGKKSQGIKTISAETGQPLGFGMAWVRYFLNGIICGLGWLLPFVDSQKQTLGDKVAKGVTVPA
jgi:uncharacterized RDD family membrane protein YckC